MKTERPASKTVEVRADSKRKLADVLEIFSAFDDIRWSDARWNWTGNRELVNHYRDDFTADEKLLSHWLCFTMDRQTSFQRVWEEGGYVISHLVRTFTRGDKSPVGTIRCHMDIPPTPDGLHLKCGSKPNARLERYGALPGDVVTFASRFMPSDALSIYRTLVILDRVAQRSLTRFIHMVIRSECQRTAIGRLAAALDFLTYKDIGSVKEIELDGRIAALEPSLKDNLDAILGDAKSFVGSLAKEFEPFGNKRLWCSVRDYLKSPEFNSYLVSALDQIDREEARRWHRNNKDLKDALAVMELPGDVWNNNSVFRNGLFTPHLSGISGSEIPKSLDMPRVVRQIYEQLSDQNTSFYPEQLDVSFDFVPRMCDDPLMCHVCIFGGGIGKLCHEESGKLCPVALSACGYIHPCDPSKCVFKPKAKSLAGVCDRSTAPKSSQLEGVGK